MSSAVESTSAAWRRPFLFDAVEALVRPDAAAHALEPTSLFDAKKPSAKQAWALITPASRLEIRPAPLMASSGIPALDAFTGGLPRGCLTEICGPTSSGRTSMLLSALAAATMRGEFCALIDGSDSLDPHSALAAGIDLDRLLWVRCNEDAPSKNFTLSRRPSQNRAGTSQPPSQHFKKSHPDEHRLEQLLRATDLLLESGGFGLIILDLADLPPASVRRIPLTTWFRFRRAVEHKSTILLTIEQQPIAGSCSSMLLQLCPQTISRSSVVLHPRHKSPESQQWQCWQKMREAAECRTDGTRMNSHAEHAHKLPPTHAQLLTELQIHVELVRSRLDRKPSQSIAFETRTAWAG